MASRTTNITAFAMTMAMLLLGNLSFGLVTMLVFSSGFLTGYFLWLLVRSKATFVDINAPYLLAFGGFILHRVEEKQMDFFATLAGITGVQTPDILSPQIILLVAGSAGAWILIPFLLNRGHEFGRYLAWTFFTALGITELAHFLIFPFFTGDPYGYFPGMASVILLAPAAWWGMWRLSRE